jgi:hypothetical protein
MSFEPTKVIEMNKGKQIGNTLMQDASSIPYNNTNVKAELDTINSNLSELQNANLGTSVSLNNGVAWQATSDGYVDFGCDGASGEYATLSLNAVLMGRVAYANGIAHNPNQALFVKKGMFVTLGGTTTATATFHPLT